MGLCPCLPQVSSTPMNGLRMTLAPFKIWLCATEACQRGATAYPVSLAHVGRAWGSGGGVTAGLPQATSSSLRTDARQRGCNGPCAWGRGAPNSPASSAGRSGPGPASRVWRQADRALLFSFHLCCVGRPKRSYAKDHLAVFRPCEVSSPWRLIEESPRRMRLQFAFIPLVAIAVIQGAREDHYGANFI